MLSDATLRTARAKARKAKRPLKFYDENGLYVRVGKTGIVKWKFRYQFDGKERGETFGSYPATTLKGARKIRDKWLKILEKGKDPRVVIAAKERKKRRQRNDTFGKLADEWMAAGCPGGKGRPLDPKTVAQLSRRYELHLKDPLGDEPIGTISTKQIKAVLVEIQDRGTLETARRVRAVARRIFDFAIEEDRAESNPAAAKITLRPVEKQHFAAITDEAKIGPLLQAIDGYEWRHKVIGLALRIAPHTLLRPGELRKGEWNEVNIDRAEWRIPAHRMKSKREHIVPLTTQVIDMLTELHEKTGHGTLMFPGERSSSRPISDNTLNASLRRMGYGKDEMTAHGFRSMASTRLNEMLDKRSRRRFDAEVIEFQLAHKDPDDTRASYNRFDPYKLIIPRRKMMQEWSNYLDKLKAGKEDSAQATVTPIKSA